MRKTILALAIGAIVIGGAAVAAAQSDDPGDDATPAEHPFRGAVLLDVLDELVDDGVIDRGQRDAIVDALKAKRSEVRALREEVREQLTGFWEDDVLTAEEISRLPEWHPLRRLTEYLEDGQLAREELGEARAELGPRHHRRGPGGFGGLDG